MNFIHEIVNNVMDFKKQELGHVNVTRCFDPRVKLVKFALLAIRVSTPDMIAASQIMQFFF